MTVYLGIDWSERKHDGCFLNDAGVVVVQLTIPHSPDGFAQLDAQRQALGVAAGACLVGLETAHTLLIDDLWARGYRQVYVIPPSLVSSSRGRYGQSGARTDQTDSVLLADLLRSDRGRLQPWHPDAPLTRQLRATVGLVAELTRETTRLSNRLRAVLLRYYPAAVPLFSKLTTQIALHFIVAYPTPAAAAALEWPQFAAFGQTHGYRARLDLQAAFARLQQPTPAPDSVTVTVCQPTAVCLAHLLLNVVQAKLSQERELLRLFGQHPDQAVFASLPGAGDYLGPALLVHFGDDRARFPTPASIQALAGTCPVTKQSGRRRTIQFRRACDHDFRHIAQQWARASLRRSSWARTYYDHVYRRCGREQQAYRCLANRWLAIAWKLWQTRQPYDEAYHLRQRLAQSRP